MRDAWILRRGLWNMLYERVRAAGLRHRVFLGAVRVDGDAYPMVVCLELLDTGKTYCRAPPTEGERGGGKGV